MLSQLYVRLMRNDCRLPEDWVGSHLERLDRVDGDIDHLIQGIAHIRTWTYITHRGDWLDDNAHWQGRARAIERSGEHTSELQSLMRSSYAVVCLRNK